MYQQDFIKRLILQFTQVMLQIAGLSQAGRLGEALALIDQTYDELFGLSSSVVFYSSAEELIQRVSRGDRDDPQRIRILADLLRSEAQVNQARGQDFDAHQRRLKSLDLHLAAARMDPALDPESTLGTVLELRDDIQSGGMPAQTQANLFFYFEDHGHYRHALDTLEAYLSRAGRPEEVRPHVLDFCRRMLALPEAGLAQGGLSRAEVEAVLARESRRA